MVPYGPFNFMNFNTFQGISTYVNLQDLQAEDCQKWIIVTQYDSESVAIRELAAGTKVTTALLKLRQCDTKHQHPAIH